MKSKRKFFDGLDERWKEAYRWAVREWIATIKRGGRRRLNEPCALCREARRHTGRLEDRCFACKLSRFLGQPCVDSAAWENYALCVQRSTDPALTQAERIATRKKRLSIARDILRRLKDALPKNDEVRVKAEQVLETT